MCRLFLGRTEHVTLFRLLRVKVVNQKDLFAGQEEAQPHVHPEDLAAQTDQSSSASTSLEVDTSSEASSGRSRRSFIGLSDKELLKCAFPHPQAEGATESPGTNGEHLSQVFSYPLKLRSR